ncbi:hypothetical protein PC9H_004031 [Pleurotus ostreatus]|uniref:DUF6533 domain-containing protein n=1 Tax=Pleurotus ostreatus TaxID=5322 RepID=A0A8H7DVY2_PLEOS|nr:uncharacterized protein PC9H_004031 [Pleurotus ostreatus]KAF7437195.1 hypothetical protein PC9H_004031 [Pleurotus ostreatus]KAJ8703072.1 hypothetical protein PTI98_001728 [Pleurotus ostreatus]
MVFAAIVQDDQLRGLQSCNYSAMAALAFTVWDIVVSFEDEVEQIWLSAWTRLKFLYIFLRYFSLIAQVIATILTLGLAAPLYPGRSVCLLLLSFQAISSQALMMGVQVLLVLRVIALYNRVRWLRTFLSVLFLAEVVLMTVFFGISLSSMDYGVHCVITGFPITATGFLIPPILYESLLFVLTMVKFYQALRDGWGRQPVISRFMSHGIWAFGAPFVILTVNTLCMALLKGAIASVAYSWIIAIPPFAGARLILSMSHLFSRQPSMRRTTSHDQVLLDTTIMQMTYPSHTATDAGYGSSSFSWQHGQDPNAILVVDR